MIVLDASVAVKLVTEELGSEAALRRVTEEAERIAPDWIKIEVASALTNKVRRTDLGMETATIALRALPDFFTEIADSDQLIEPTMALSVELDHAFYDCLYLALALNRGCRLITDDRQFAAAASRAYPHAIEALR